MTTEFLQPLSFHLTIRFFSIQSGFPPILVKRNPDIDDPPPFSFGVYENGSLWIDSYFMSKEFLLHSSASVLIELELKLYFNLTTKSTQIEILEEKFKNSYC